MTVRAEFHEIERLIAQAIELLERHEEKDCRETLDAARLKLHEAIEKMEIRTAYEGWP